MRLKDFIVNKAIVIAQKFDGQESNETSIDKVIIKCADKLGYKVSEDVTSESSIAITDPKFKELMSRFTYNNKRFLEWSDKFKCSIYCGQDGLLYKGMYGRTMEELSEEEGKEYYDKYHDFLNFLKEYYKSLKKTSIRYKLIGFDDKNKYYYCSDGKFYFKDASNIYNFCTDDMTEKLAKYTSRTKG